MDEHHLPRILMIYLHHVTTARPHHVTFTSDLDCVRIARRGGDEITPEEITPDGITP